VVIDQLGERATDHAAIAALVHASAHADYYLTRAQAVAALGNFTAPAAMDAVAAATRDTSAAVRTAAVTALGTLGGQRAIGIIRDAFAHDSSYHVRAAAVTAYARADSAHADAMLSAALRLPSYREVIRHAALQAVALRQDTARVSDVERMLALDALPAQVLGVFAAAGDAHALDALLQHVNDERAGVRRFVVDGLGVALSRPDHAAVLARVQAAAGSIVHAETKAAVEALIARIGNAKAKPPRQ